MKTTDKIYTVDTEGRAWAFAETKKVSREFSGGDEDAFCTWLLKNKLTGARALLVSENPQAAIAAVLEKYPAAEFVGFNLYRFLDLRDLYGILCSRGEVPLFPVEELSQVVMCRELSVPVTEDQITDRVNLFSEMVRRNALVAYKTLHPSESSSIPSDDEEGDD